MDNFYIWMLVTKKKTFDFQKEKIVQLPDLSVGNALEQNEQLEEIV